MDGAAEQVLPIYFSGIIARRLLQKGWNRNIFWKSRNTLIVASEVTRASHPGDLTALLQQSLDTSLGVVGRSWATILEIASRLVQARALDGSIVEATVTLAELALPMTRLDLSPLMRVMNDLLEKPSDPTSLLLRNSRLAIAGVLAWSEVEAADDSADATLMN